MDLVEFGAFCIIPVAVGGLVCWRGVLSILWSCAVCSCEVEIGLVRYRRRRGNELLMNVDIDYVGSLSEID